MTRTRTLSLAAAAALAFAAGIAMQGCGKSCGDQTPTVGVVNNAASCSAPAGALVTVSFHVCPKCDQGTPSCIVHADNAAAGQITLEPVAEVCDPQSCPLVDANTCLLPTLDCQFTAVAPTIAGPTIVTITTPGAPETFTLNVTAPVSNPTPVTCSL